MKLYLMGPSIVTEDSEVRGFFSWRTLYIKGRKRYSKAFVLHKLFDDLKDRGSKDTMAFTALNDAEEYLRQWNCDGSEPRHISIKNPSIFVVPQKPRIVYEIEVPDSKAHLLKSAEIKRFCSGAFEAGNPYEEKGIPAVEGNLRDILLDAGQVLSVRMGPTRYLLPYSLSAYQAIALNNFIDEYKAQCKREWFVNPWSRMKRLIAANEVDMGIVYEHAFSNPKSRTAKVLHRMIGDKSLLLEAAPEQACRMNLLFTVPLRCEDALKGNPLRELETSLDPLLNEISQFAGFGSITREEDALTAKMRNSLFYKSDKHLLPQDSSTSFVSGLLQKGLAYFS